MSVSIVIHHHQWVQREKKKKEKSAAPPQESDTSWIVWRTSGHSITKHGLNDDFYELQLWLIWKGISSWERILHAAQRNEMKSVAFLCHQHAEHELHLFSITKNFSSFTYPERILNCYTLNLLFDKLLSSQWWCFFSHSLASTYCDGSAQYGIITIAFLFILYSTAISLSTRAAEELFSIPKPALKPGLKWS